MRKNATKVIRAFLDGKPAVGDSKRTIWTDGQTLWSYALPIAWKRDGWDAQGRAHYPTLADNDRYDSEPTGWLPLGIRVRNEKSAVRPDGQLSRTTVSQIRAIRLAVEQPDYFDKLSGRVPWNLQYQTHDDEPSKF